MMNVAVQQKWLTTRNLTSLILAVLLLWVVISPVAVSAFVGLGGYIGEKILGDGTNTNLWLGDGTNTILVLGSAPTISTLPVTNNVQVGGVNQATLQGNLANLNGMPSATGYFQWGYAPGFLINTTPSVVYTTTGTKTANISGILTGVQVYYRFVVVTDGTSTGNTVTFVSGGAVGVGINWAGIMFPLVIAACILLFIMMRWNNLPLALAGAIIGFIALEITLTIIKYLNG